MIEEHEGVKLDPSFVFDVQVKRLHEYKRQLMNALSIMDIYFGLKDGSIQDFTPTAFIFGAKAAPGYVRAKAIIRYINRVAELVNNDPAVADKMKVVFVQNYNCSYAEHIIPAADISEQISPAGTEASGTGNMKLMLNGAVTLGTMDGANVEIVERAGLENNYIFGASVEEINDIRESYCARDVYNSNPRIRRAVDTLVNGTVPTDSELRELYTSLLDGASWHRPDHYFLLKDLPSYQQARLQANRGLPRPRGVWPQVPDERRVGGLLLVRPNHPAVREGNLEAVTARGIMIGTAENCVGGDASYIDPAKCTVFFGDLRQIRNCPMGRCGHRPLRTFRKCTEPLQGRTESSAPYEEQCVLSGGKKLDRLSPGQRPGLLWDLEEGSAI